MDRALVKTIAAEIEAAVAKVGAARGMTYQPGRITFDPVGGTVTLKVTLASTEADTGITTAARAAWAEYAPLFKLPADGLGRCFDVGGKAHRVVGLRLQARTKPVLTECGGKQYVWPAHIVALYLNHPAPNGARS